MTVDSRDQRTSANNLPFITLFPYPVSGVSAADRMIATGEYAIHPWVSATTVNLDTGWDNSAYAHDGNTGNFAKETSQSGQTFLELEWDSGIWTDMVRFFAHDEDIIAGTHDATSVYVDVWRDGAWVNLTGGITMTEDVWFNYPIGAKIVGDKIRIKSLDTDEYLNIAGVQFINLAAFSPDAVMPKVGFDRTRNPLLGGSLAK